MEVRGSFSLRISGGGSEIAALAAALEPELGDLGLNLKKEGENLIITSVEFPQGRLKASINSLLRLIDLFRALWELAESGIRET